MKRKWNTIDTILVLAVAAILVVGVWFLAGSSGENTAQDKTVAVLIELTQQDQTFTELPKVGDSVTLGVKEKMPATVAKVEILPSYSITADMVNGRYREEAIAGKYNVQITVAGSGTETDEAVEINGNPLRVGEACAIKSKQWAGYGFILDVATAD